MDAQRSFGLRSSRLLRWPELNIVAFAFLLHLPWEFWQVPFFAHLGEQAHWDGIKVCTKATLGDAGIALVSFWITALTARSRDWISNPSRRELVVFVACGVVITIAFEWTATQVLHLWAYNERMPVVPGVGTGLLPMLQWLLIPPLLLWIVRRQVR